MNRAWELIVIVRKLLSAGFYSFDVARLACASRLINFVDFRLGIKQKTFEQGLALTAFVGSILNNLHAPGPWWVGTTFGGATSFIIGFLGREAIRTPNDIRMFLLVTGRGAVGRLFWLFLAVAMLCLLQFEFLLFFGAMTVFLHVTALPYRDDPPKRKRRLSLSKVKELFGGGWLPKMPKPVEEHA